MRTGTSFMFFLICRVVCAQIIAPERITGWSFAGYPGPIPDPELVLNATDFGAVADSLTDNSTALQNAIDFLEGRHV